MALRHIDVLSAKPTTTASGEVLRQDVPCSGCGYNLRGLTPPNVCPECGEDLRRSIEAFRARTQPLPPPPPPDPRWARRIRQGAWLAVLAFVALLVPTLAPSEWYRMPFRNAPISLTPGRVVLLSFTCVGWVLAWASAWRLTTPEQCADGRPEICGSLATPTARMLCTAYMLFPFAWAWANWNTQYPTNTAIMPAVALLVSGLIGTMALMIRIGRLLARRNAIVLAAVAYLLALVLPLLPLFSWDLGRRDPSSLGMMIGLSAFPAGPPEIIWELVRSFRRNNLDVWFVWLILLIPALNLTMAIRLISGYRRQSIDAGPLNAAAVPA